MQRLSQLGGGLTNDPVEAIAYRLVAAPRQDERARCVATSARLGRPLGEARLGARLEHPAKEPDVLQALPLQQVRVRLPRRRRRLHPSGLDAVSEREGV